SVQIPVIGIGAGSEVDGQVLVTHDLIGLFDKFVPKFVKQYTRIRTSILEALANYKHEVQEQSFPAEEHCFSMPEETLEELKKRLGKTD
ncbi:MAG: 3-methyl-2-oxobutanoate hydroxymethyltransferase, partial [Desulfohalobiaceae bacterium]|nr:3-methyl-2-oxobutanoate hydroxymethyltransferase [Desulfohalobiaceae bacterium]